MPKSDTLLQIELEQSRMLREKAKVVMEKSVALYVLFTLVSVLGFFFEYVSSGLLTLLVILGILILVIGTLPYLLVMAREEKRLDELAREHRK